MHKCSGEFCATEEEQAQFFEDTKIILLALSGKEFDQGEYDESPVKNKPFVSWTAIKPEKYHYQQFNIRKHFVESDDKLFSLGIAPTNHEYLTYEKALDEEFDGLVNGVMY